MTDIASRPPRSPRFRSDRPTLERRAGAWLQDFRTAALQPGFSVAATGLRHKMTVVTNNTKDFRRIPGLTPEDWR
ncbi:MAG: hypothetical protein WEB53_15800 [Akkermansiaceae bacterium]